MKPFYTLENWWVIRGETIRLVGNSNRYEGIWKHNQRITTSVIGRNLDTMETKNSFYKLGKPAEEFVRELGESVDAKEELFKWVDAL